MPLDPGSHPLLSPPELARGRGAAYNKRVMIAFHARTDRRWLHRVVAWAVAFVMCVPVLLGSAYVPAMQALGLGATHACACGMEKGTCGCPECEELEKGEAHAREVGISIAKKTCRDEDNALGSGALPLATLSDEFSISPPGHDERTWIPSVSSLASRLASGPSPPPPRV